MVGSDFMFHVIGVSAIFLLIVLWVVSFQLNLRESRRENHESRKNEAK